MAVARAVVASPKLILADEPTGNLHSSQGDEIMQLFARLNQEGTTVIQVTHSDRNASYGSRTIQLSDGWMVKARLIRQSLNSAGWPLQTHAGRGRPEAVVAAAWSDLRALPTGSGETRCQWPQPQDRRE